MVDTIDLKSIAIYSVIVQFDCLEFFKLKLA